MAMILLWFMLNFADIGITLVCLKGGFTELNPLWTAYLSLNVWVYIKGVLAALVVLGLMAWHRPRLIAWLNAGLGGVVLWNLCCLSSYRSRV